MGNRSGVFTSGGFAYASDTGALFYDADGNFGSGVVMLGRIYSTDMSNATPTPAALSHTDFVFGL